MSLIVFELLNYIKCDVWWELVVLFYMMIDSESIYEWERSIEYVDL